MHATKPPRKPSQWRQLRPDDRTGFVVVMRPVDPDGCGRYWCGPADPDSSTTWLRHRDAVTGVVTVPTRMAVFATAWHATTAWAGYLAARRHRGTPVREFAHFLPLEHIADRSRVPPMRPPTPPRSSSRPPTLAGLADQTASPAMATRLQSSLTIAKPNLTGAPT